jgi:hypothetical protein
LGYVPSRPSDTRSSRCSGLDTRAADPAQLACSVRGHRRIEAALHWIRDVVCGEDHSQTRTHNGPHDVAVLHTAAINALRLTRTSAPACDNTRAPLLPLATLGLM